jgi:hypothetical protein
MQTVSIGPWRCGVGQPLLWIVGPCVIESHELTLHIAAQLRALAEAVADSADLQGILRQGQPQFGQVVPGGRGCTRGYARSKRSSARRACA